MDCVFWQKGGRKAKSCSQTCHSWKFYFLIPKEDMQVGLVAASFYQKLCLMALYMDSHTVKRFSAKQMERLILWCGTKRNNLVQGLGIGPSQWNFWNKSIITTEHFTITVSVITRKMDFFSRIEKIHTNSLSSFYFSKRNEKERGFIELKKILLKIK